MLLYKSVKRDVLIKQKLEVDSHHGLGPAGIVGVAGSVDRKQVPTAGDKKQYVSFIGQKLMDFLHV